MKTTPLNLCLLLLLSTELSVANQLQQFAGYSGNEELSVAMTKVTDLLVDLKLKSTKQSDITSFLIRSNNDVH